MLDNLRFWQQELPKRNGYQLLHKAVNNAGYYKAEFIFQTSNEQANNDLFNILPFWD